MTTPVTPGPQTAAELAARLSAERLGVPFLLFRDAAGAQQLISLPRAHERVTIGRHAGNVIALVWDDEVSGVHAELVPVAGEWAISDQGLSRNGTFVNGQLVTGRRRLRDGDVLRFGSSLIVYGAVASNESGVTRQAAEVTDIDELTAIQRRILSALCRPLVTGGDGALPASNQAIADDVNLSVQGVKGQLRTLAERFGCGALPQNRKRLALAERAVRGGFGGSVQE